MSYINVGVTFGFSGNILTKKELKEWIVNHPDKIIAYSTSGMGEQFYGPVSNLQPGITLSVVGPDPYNSRKWYASISLVNGKLKVS